MQKVWEVNGRGERLLSKAGSGPEEFAGKWEGKKLARGPSPKARVRILNKYCTRLTGYAKKCNIIIGGTYVF